MANEKNGSELLELSDIICSREYNWGIVRTRQLTEELVRRLCDASGVAYTTLADSIEALFEGGFIDEESRVNLHNLRILGNKAAHEGDNDQGDAKNAYYLYRTELYKERSRTGEIRYERTPVQVSMGGRSSLADEEMRPAKNSRDREVSVDAGMSGARRRTSGSGKNGKKGKGGKNSKGSQSNIYTILKYAIPALVAILLIVFLITLITTNKSNKEIESETEIITTESVEETTEEETTTEAETEPPTTAAPVEYKTRGTGVRLRYANDPGRIYASVQESGTVLGPIEDYETDNAEYKDKFVRVHYDGQDLIVSKDFIEPVE